MAALAENLVLHRLRPQTVAQAAEVKHAVPGRLRLALHRDDAATLAAVIAAIEAAGGTIRGKVRPGSLLVRYSPDLVGESELLGAPLATSLPLPAARVSSETVIDAPIEAVWSALTDPEGEVWRAPDSLEVTRYPTNPPSWTVDVELAGRSFPHTVAMMRVDPPRVLEVSVTGKLHAVVRADLAVEGSHQCRLLQRLWFLVDGGLVEGKVGEKVVESFVNRFSDEVPRRIAAQLLVNRTP